MHSAFYKNKRAAFALTAIIVFYLFNGIVYLRYQTITADEAGFYNYAVRFLKGHPTRVFPGPDNSKMPVSVLNTIPRLTEKVLYGANTKSDGGVSDIIHGRYVTLLFSVFTLLLVFQWAKELYGTRAALFAAFLFSFCPNNLANAGLVSTDAYATFFLLATLYAFFRFYRHGSLKNFLLLSIFAALSQLVKQSLFYLYILLPTAFVVWAIVKRPVVRWPAVVGGCVLFMAINWLVINTGFYFYESNLPAGSYTFHSLLFQKVQELLPDALPLPLPKPFVTGLDLAKYYDQLGGGFPESSFAKVTILGQASTGGSFWYYYFVTLFFKTPIPVFIFGAWSIVLYLRSRSTGFMAVFLLLAPVVYYLFVFSFFYKTQCGVRHIIFMYPLLFILFSNVAVDITTRKKQVVFVVLSAWLCISVLSFWKNYYPYTNEFIANKKNGYKYVGVANIELLQGGRFLAHYLETHPDVRPAPQQPANGRFILSMASYVDNWNLHRYDWLKSYEPVSHVAATYLVFDIGNAAVEK